MPIDLHQGKYNCTKYFTVLTRRVRLSSFKSWDLNDGSSWQALNIRSIAPSSLHSLGGGYEPTYARALGIPPSPSRRPRKLWTINLVPSPPLLAFYC